MLQVAVLVSGQGLYKVNSIVFDLLFSNHCLIFIILSQEIMKGSLRLWTTNSQVVCISVLADFFKIAQTSMMLIVLVVIKEGVFALINRNVSTLAQLILIILLLSTAEKRLLRVRNNIGRSNDKVFQCCIVHIRCFR